MEPETDASFPLEGILDKCRKGDQQAFKVIYDSYSTTMFSTALRMLNRHEEAEEILQDAFIAAFRDLNQLRDSKSFGAWLKRITMNRCLDRLRQRKISFETLDELDLADEQEESGPDHPYTVEMVVAALQELDDAYRVVFTLHLFEDHSHRMIAEKLGITETNSKAILHRAKRKLAALLHQTATS